MINVIKGGILKDSSFFCLIMKKEVFTYSIPEPDWIQKLCVWADSNFPYFAFQNGNSFEYPYNAFETRFLAGSRLLNPKEIFETREEIIKVGIISYDFKNQLEHLYSRNKAFIELPDLCFFEASLILTFQDGQIFSNQALPATFWEEVAQIDLSDTSTTTCELKAQLSKEEYLSAVAAIKHQLVEGNTYECNYCQAFYGEFEAWDPISSYFKLNQISPMPFSALFKAKGKWLVSASPERYLKKSGAKLIAQPIKGTIRRGKTDLEDLQNKTKLAQSEKEQAENLMITDLMRNDLSKVAVTGSVDVEELFGIYAMPRVFQMISTVCATLQATSSFAEIINATFPMGSMTGAPKIKTMEIIEELEKFQRGWFSGAFGVIEKNGDFDFSVIIRSIVADKSTKKLYLGVGSAITYDADALQEYEECLLKIKVIQEVLSGT